MTAPNRSTGFDISVVLPAFGRVPLLHASLQSVLMAARRAAPLSVECVVVDDGSSPSLAEALSDFQAAFGPPHDFRVIRQDNAGSAAARANGLNHCRGEYVQFLDSDDLIHPEKLAAHVRAMRQTWAELSYCDQATARPYDPLQHPQEPPLVSQEQLPVARTPADLFLGIQTAPHTPVFRRDALLAALADPIIPPSRVFEPAGDTWLFFNCATQPWRVCKVDGAFAIYVNHDEGRHSTKWEKTGIPALGISLVLDLRCPETPATRHVREMLGTAAYRSFRRLPRHFDPEYERLTFALYEKNSSLVPASRLGSRRFVRLVKLIGPRWAAGLVGRLQRSPYGQCQTITRQEFDELFVRMLRHVITACGSDAFEGRYGPPARIRDTKPPANGTRVPGR